jgi:hypothetical protein
VKCNSATLILKENQGCAVESKTNEGGVRWAKAARLSALARLEARIELIDDIDAALAADDAASLVAGLHRLEGIDDLHGSNSMVHLSNRRRT